MILSILAQAATALPPIALPPVPANAIRFEDLGLARMIAPEDLGPAPLWRAVLDELARPDPPEHRLSFGGTGAIVAEVIAAMAEATQPEPNVEGQG